MRAEALRAALALGLAACTPFTNEQIVTRIQAEDELPTHGNADSPADWRRDYDRRPEELWADLVRVASAGGRALVGSDPQAGFLVFATQADGPFAFVNVYARTASGSDGTTVLVKHYEWRTSVGRNFATRFVQHWIVSSVALRAGPDFLCALDREIGEHAGPCAP
jgi:hypothetical protein